MPAKVVNATTSHLPGYPWPPEEKYWDVRNAYYHFPQDQVDDFVRDFAEINQLFLDSIAQWNSLLLWEDGAPGFRADYGQSQPSVALKTHPDSTNRPTVLICPGGAFLWKASYEGAPVAQRLFDLGFNAAVLNYRTAPYHLDVSLGDGKRAIRYLRARAEKLGIHPNKIAIMGFSAGARLSGIVGTGFDAGDPNAADPVEQASSRPNAVVSCYGSRSLVAFPGCNLTHNRSAQRYFYYRSADAMISPQTPPFFIWQCCDMDDPRGALNMANRLTVCGVPFEMHLFPFGAHGTALSNGGSPTEGSDDPHVARWVEMCVKWLRAELDERKAETLSAAEQVPTGSIDTHPFGYPWPPEEKYKSLRDETGHLSEEYIPQLTREYAHVRKLHYDSISRWDMIPLWDEGAPNFREDYGHPQPCIAIKTHGDDKVRATIIVCPGGANLWKTDYEGIPVAQWFYEQGFNAAVLDYRVTPYLPEDGQDDAKRAVRLLRARQKELGLTSDAIVLMGFSAGARLSNAAAAGFQLGNSDAADLVERYSSRPDAVVLGYGAFSEAAFPSAHSLSHDRELQAKYAARSGDTLVTSKAPPYFIWQRCDMDDPRNVTNLANELTKHGVPFELHIFPYGPHGSALCDGNNPTLGADDPIATVWKDLCVEWLHLTLGPKDKNCSNQ